ncbi:2-C-methyl-D-erythritol 2,4-cyclodiphosphate synthase [Metallumcola ferriviriculae]|uniref:2-C-methyl-D-erythritol 2,4-cyclodiphosphate synthase n=1 Tax=Metallumcola ferriviriculae TaxID=3039180 RepID=A0AAU0UJJ6_9FIRM|nr:2-C-methyl-D-erythritol 2,4-cyclodiphosphate synthase [Desulfitibacteraceae bacterium MK1]
MRVGIGYDVHRLVPERKLIVGGELIDYHLGLLGHSDADVLTHAIMDALLGTVGLGDIGKHFPDSDPSYQGISSLKLLAEVVGKIREQGYEIGNIDGIIIAERPKMSPYIPRMVTRLANVTALKEDQINIKATTTEGLGYTGEGKGIAAQAIAMVL